MSETPARHADYGRSPWDDPTDPKPQRYDAEGRWTAEFAEWVKRQGHRRWAYYFGPEGVLIDGADDAR